MEKIDKGIKKTIKLLPIQRYKLAIPQIVKNKCVYVLEKEKGAFASSVFEDRIIIAMWPAEEYAAYNAVKDWEEYNPKKIVFEDLEAMLDYLEDNEYHIDMFPVDSTTGYLVTVDEFINDLNAFSESEYK